MLSLVVTPSGTFIEQFAEKEGTLKDAVQIGDKIMDLYRRSFNKAELCYGDNFCAYCSGTPSHPAHRCPACSAKVHFLLKSMSFSCIKHDFKAVHPCGPCVREGTECTFAGLSSVCHACHKSVTHQCVGGIPNRQILLMPYQDLHPEDDQHILDIIDELIDVDPYGASKFLISAFSGLRLLIPRVYRTCCRYW